MELGQILFGNVNEDMRFNIPRNKGFEHTLKLLTNALGTSFLYPQEYENDVFYINGFNDNKTCTCGYDTLVNEFHKTHSHSKNCYINDFLALEEKLKIKWNKESFFPLSSRQKGEYEKQIEQLYIKHNLDYDKDNIIRGCAIRCSCDYDKKWEEFLATHHHSEDCKILKPNFHYKPANFKLYWYKYPMRSSYSNKQVSLAEFNSMVLQCIDSLSIKVTEADVWTFGADAIFIPTNGYVKKNGGAVMGRGVALQAKNKFKNIDLALGRAISVNGNFPQLIYTTDSLNLYSFPTKHYFKQQSDLNLIGKSFKALIEILRHTNYKKVVLPLPGCGNGQLDWISEVRPLLEKIAKESPYYDNIKSKLYFLTNELN